MNHTLSPAPFPVMPPCIGCGATEGLWPVNPPGGYDRPAMSACTPCLRTPVLSGLVPRLLECYPPEHADALRAALA